VWRSYGIECLLYYRVCYITFDSNVRAGPQVCVQAAGSGTGHLNLGYF
jgi:hypothetical protein